MFQVPQRVRARLAQVGEKVASCPLGQILCRGTDWLLWTLETSVQWFVDSNDPNENGSSKQGSFNLHTTRHDSNNHTEELLYVLRNDTRKPKAVLVLNVV